MAQEQEKQLAGALCTCRELLLRFGGARQAADSSVQSCNRDMFQECTGTGQHPQQHLGQGSSAPGDCAIVAFPRYRVASAPACFVMTTVKPIHIISAYNLVV